MKSDTCREKLKGKREVHRRSDVGKSGNSQAAKGVHSAAVLYGLAFVLCPYHLLYDSVTSNTTILKARMGENVLQSSA